MPKLGCYCMIEKMAKIRPLLAGFVRCHMVAKIITGGLRGIEGLRVLCECDLSNGLPAFEIVGLPDASVKEARDRVRSAVKNCGFEFPLRRITVNLAPADLKKEGPVYDLPVLLGILAASGQIPRPGRIGAFWGSFPWMAPCGP